MGTKLYAISLEELALGLSSTQDQDIVHGTPILYREDICIQMYICVCSFLSFFLFVSKSCLVVSFDIGLGYMLVQITAYFMELATPHTEEAIKLVDKVGGFEWLINKYEIDGSSALKLDLSLDTPIIIVPKNSTSKESVFLK